MEALSTAQIICYCNGPQKFDPFGRAEAIGRHAAKSLHQTIGFTIQASVKERTRKQGCRCFI
jgi:hypothetical protein